jgi:hypothetical protein
VILLPRPYIRRFIGITCLLVASLWSGGSLICVCHGHFPESHKKWCSEDCDSKPNPGVKVQSFFSAVSRVTCSCVDDTSECCSSISWFMIAQRRASQRDQNSPIKVYKASLLNSMSDASSSEENAGGVPHQPHYCGLNPVQDHLQTTVLVI